MNQNEIADKGLLELLAFFQRGSSYDVLQAHQGNGWGGAWTFAPCDVHAAEKAAWMLRRAGAREVRHTRRARLFTGAGNVQKVMVVTDLPKRLQAVLRIADGCVLSGLPYLADESVVALESAFAPSAEVV